MRHEAALSRQPSGPWWEPGRAVLAVALSLVVTAMVPLLMVGRALTADKLADPVDKRRPT